MTSERGQKNAVSSLPKSECVVNMVNAKDEEQRPFHNFFLIVTVVGKTTLIRSHVSSQRLG